MSFIGELSPNSKLEYVAIGTNQKSIAGKRTGFIAECQVQSPSAIVRRRENNVYLSALSCHITKTRADNRITNYIYSLLCFQSGQCVGPWVEAQNKRVTAKPSREARNTKRARP